MDKLQVNTLVSQHQESRTSTVELSPQLNARLVEIAIRHDLSKEDVLRRAFALFDVAVKAKEDGERLGFFDSENKLTKELVGLF